MRYTQYKGFAQVTNRVKLKFAAINLKKLRHLEEGTENSLSGEDAEKDSLNGYSFRVAIFPFRTQKPALA